MLAARRKAGTDAIGPTVSDWFRSRVTIAEQGVRGNNWIEPEVWSSEALANCARRRELRVTRFLFFGTAAVFLMMFATRLPAQAIMAEQDTCPISGNVSGVARFPVPSARLLPHGCETSTRPWSAPVGHRQPQAADVAAPSSSFEQDVDEEHAKIHRVIRGICRGC